MIKPEFSDFYKFTTSFGIILIIIGMYSLFFVSNYGFDAAETFLKDYSPEKLTSQGYSNQTINAFDSLYAAKLTNANKLIKLTPWIALLFSIIGGFLFGFGMLGWWTKQKSLMVY